MHVFAKDNLTFNNTFITTYDLEQIKRHFNESNMFEKELIVQEPLVKKLIDNGVLVKAKLPKFHNFGKLPTLSITTYKTLKVSPIVSP